MFNYLDPQFLIQTFGLIGLFLIIFAESGLFFGFFLPGDSLLFTAGILAASGLLPLWPLLIGGFLAAVLGDTVGYWFGRKVGPRIFTKEDSLFFHKAHIARAEHFYEKYGPKTILLARFIPIVRTFAPIVAGVGSMKYPLFLAYNLIGGVVWAVGIPLMGFFLGQAIPSIDAYLVPIIILIIAVSFVPVIVEVVRHWRSERLKKR